MTHAESKGTTRDAQRNLDARRAHVGASACRGGRRSAEPTRVTYLVGTPTSCPCTTDCAAGFLNPPPNSTVLGSASTAA